MFGCILAMIFIGASFRCIVYVCLGEGGGVERKGEEKRGRKL